MFLLLGLLACTAVLALLSLRRGVAAQPIVEGLLILLLIRGRLGWVIAGVATYLLVFTFGSAVNQILFYMLGLRTGSGSMRSSRGCRTSMTSGGSWTPMTRRDRTRPWA